jgi:hypothetical protein
MQLTLVQMNFILGASSMDRVSRVILAAMAIQCSCTTIENKRRDYDQSENLHRAGKPSTIGGQAMTNQKPAYSRTTCVRMQRSYDQ